jgi:hypothetical protein
MYVSTSLFTLRAEFVHGIALLSLHALLQLRQRLWDRTASARVHFV